MSGLAGGAAWGRVRWNRVNGQHRFCAGQCFGPAKTPLRAILARSGSTVMWPGAQRIGDEPPTALILIRVGWRRPADNGLASGKAGNMNQLQEVDLRASPAPCHRIRTSRRGDRGRGGRRGVNECPSLPLWGSTPFKACTGTLLAPESPRCETLLRRRRTHGLGERWAAG